MRPTKAKITNELFYLESRLDRHQIDGPYRHYDEAKDAAERHGNCYLVIHYYQFVDSEVLEDYENSIDYLEEDE